MYLTDQSAPSSHAIDVMALVACDACHLCAPYFCAEHTCLDCGNPATTVHGSDLAPCPEPGTIAAGLEALGRRLSA